MWDRATAELFRREYRCRCGYPPALPGPGRRESVCPECGTADQHTLEIVHGRKAWLAFAAAVLSPLGVGLVGFGAHEVLRLGEWGVRVTAILVLAAWGLVSGPVFTAYMRMGNQERERQLSRWVFAVPCFIMAGGANILAAAIVGASAILGAVFRFAAGL
ncbi:MAG: hypothetical protein ACOYN0_04680 [Phycisphaerales bacterium]